MKYYPLMLGAIFMLFFSCKKADNANTISRQQALSFNTALYSNAINTTGFLVDTIPPTNAVSVKKFGAIGDGAHDDTNDIQAALNSETVLMLPAGTYLINNTLNMRPGVKLYGAGGAIIKAGDNMQGTLLSRGMYFYVSNTANCLIGNINFQKSTQPFNLGAWGNACVYIINSNNIVVNNNVFNFDLPYAKIGLAGVWVSGSSSANNIIKNNKLTSVGIEYAESGASSTIVDGNYINHAPNDGLSAHGNSDIYCNYNIVINNVIENSGLMGVEDWGNVNATLIKNNIITGVGKDPAQQKDGIGISAVGINTRVVSNKITDAPIYYIEVGGTNTIDSNIITDTQGKAIGIIGNFTGPKSKSATPVRNSNVMTITSNTITGCYRSVVIFGNYSPNVNINNNTIINPIFIGINVDSASPSYTINASDNKISFTIPNTQVRKAFESYTSLKNARNQKITLDNNIVTYDATASGGSGVEYGFEIGTNNTVINANQFNGNNIMAGNLLVYAISGSTIPISGITLTNNRVYGATVNLKAFIIKTRLGNNF
ncbi:MAG: hypothetical protein JWQ34_2208 [Mucilaginibacter sp.]|uniref:right-handed parallel beta-helix repeat-containing protein n=1 Tax=Mucilaginibacter sp. TaxID=1882438 RepID=UPI00263637B9|nr:right-handed parallel beta-helix repeat-containing protein [Mucilaginibacter sp.]MDB5003983.1 hypothetical protein [Mucilaginibacter sp.]